MKNLLLVALLIAAALFTLDPTTPPSVAGQNAGAQTENAGQEVTDRMRALLDAIRKNDAATVGQFYADDFTFTGPSGDVRTKAQRLEAIKQYPAPASLDFTDLRVRLYGETAVVTGHITAPAEGGRQAINERGIMVWVKQGGAWRVVASQLTRISPAPSAPPLEGKKP